MVPKRLFRSHIAQVYSRRTSAIPILCAIYSGTRQQLVYSSGFQKWLKGIKVPIVAIRKRLAGGCRVQASSPHR
jgi:hypothetical protein